MHTNQLYHPSKLGFIGCFWVIKQITNNHKIIYKEETVFLTPRKPINTTKKTKVCDLMVIEAISWHLYLNNLKI